MSNAKVKLLLEAKFKLRLAIQYHDFYDLASVVERLINILELPDSKGDSPLQQEVDDQPKSV